MEKIIRRDTLNEVFEVINKHRSYFENLMSETSLKMRMSEVLLDDPSNMFEHYSRELQDYASALATLELLERELKGEVEY